MLPHLEGSPSSLLQAPPPHAAVAYRPRDLPSPPQCRSSSARRPAVASCGWRSSERTASQYCASLLPPPPCRRCRHPDRPHRPRMSASGWKVLAVKCVGPSTSSTTRSSGRAMSTAARRPKKSIDHMSFTAPRAALHSRWGCRQGKDRQNGSTHLINQLIGWLNDGLVECVCACLSRWSY